jgi:hypothetical protein
MGIGSIGSGGGAGISISMGVFFICPFFGVIAGLSVPLRTTPSTVRSETW